MWYIWKNRNNKVFNNRDGNPKEILRYAEVESEVWAEAQTTIPKKNKFWAHKTLNDKHQDSQEFVL